MWEGQYDTSIVIAGNKVVSYAYRGRDVPFTRSKVTANSVSISREYTVTLTRTGETTATAKYHGAKRRFLRRLDEAVTLSKLRRPSPKR